MGGYFKPWRRKIGVLTLLMACAFLAGWVRSMANNECLQICTRTYSRIHIVSSNHVFALVQAPTAWLDETVFSFYSEQEVRNLKDVLVVDIDNGLIWSIKVAGFMIGQSEYDPNYECPKRFAVVPYWSIVIPFTLLSAFLLLSKPHKSDQKKITEPVPAEGA